MSTIRRTRENLLDIAGGYARDRGAPIQTVIKELLHFEILYALTQSPAARGLVFQGGTCLRLCHNGNRYSEDLDFAGGAGFETSQLDGFTEILKHEIGEAYGLTVDVGHRTGGAEADGLAVHRWQAKIQIPQIDRSLSQRQVINLEVANIPAHRPETMLISATYPHLTTPFRSIAIRAETQVELLADKVKALVTRPFMKSRDIWDIKFLLDRRVRLDVELLSQKLVDYGWTLEAYQAAAEKTMERISTPKASSDFRTEMSRFVDGQVAAFMDDAFCRKYLEASRQIIEDAVQQLEATHSPGPSL